MRKKREKFTSLVVSSGVVVLLSEKMVAKTRFVTFCRSCFSINLSVLNLLVVYVKTTPSLNYFRVEDQGRRSRFVRALPLPIPSESISLALRSMWSVVRSDR